MGIKRAHEAGVVSLIVTLVMMIVITLLVLGFAEISRNEQRNALDDQLSAQAYYAAESGINDAQTVITNNVKNGQAVNDKTSCNDQNGYNFNTNGDNIVDQTHSVSYTCVLVDPTPSSLAYDVGYNSKVIPLIAPNSSTFNTLTLMWQAKDGSTPAGCYTDTATQLDQLPAAGSWGCNYPVLRVDILNANVGLARANWAGNTATMFFVPFNGTYASTGTLAARGSLIPATCPTTSSGCTAYITLGGSKYYMRVTTLYQNNFRLTLNAGGIAFTGAQALVDATGKAVDVLRRVLVAVDLTDANAYAIPNGAIISQDSVCKRFGTTGNATQGSFNVYDNMTAGGSGNNLCTQQSPGSPVP